jgi:hypothetical protein
VIAGDSRRRLALSHGEHVVGENVDPAQDRVGVGTSPRAPASMASAGSDKVTVPSIDVLRVDILAGASRASSEGVQPESALDRDLVPGGTTVVRLEEVSLAGSARPRRRRKGIGAGRVAEPCP